MPSSTAGAVGPTRVIDSGNVATMVDSSSAQLLAEIRERHRKIRFHRWWLFFAIGIGIIGLVQQLAWLVVVACVLLVVGVPLLWVVDRRRKQVDLQYNLDATYNQAYQALLTAFGQFRSAGRIWLVQSEATVLDGKYHAGASSLVKRTVIAPSLCLPPYFKSNIIPPSIPAGRQTLYLFPDVIIVVQGNNLGTVSYSQLNLACGTTQFIEDGSRPRDAQQVGQTWRFVNKSGGPDRRFANNRVFPMMLYGVMRWQSSTGLNEEYHISRADVVPPFEARILAMARMPTSPARSVPAQAAPARPPWPKI